MKGGGGKLSKGLSIIINKRNGLNLKPVIEKIYKKIEVVEKDIKKSAGQNVVIKYFDLGTLTPNKRWVHDIPADIMNYQTKIIIDVEVFYSGDWGSVGDFVWESTTAGTGVHIYKNKIICRTGTSGITGQSYGGGSPFENGVVISSGKARAVILCMDNKENGSSTVIPKSQSIVEVIWSGNSKTGNLQLSKSISLFDLLEFETDAFPGRQNTTVSVHAFGGFKGAFSITNIPWGGNIQNETAAYVNDTTIKVAAAYGGGNVRVIRGIKL